jgi:hypothetical protein
MLVLVRSDYVRLSQVKMLCQVVSLGHVSTGCVSLGLVRSS